LSSVESPFLSRSLHALAGSPPCVQAFRRDSPFRRGFYRVETSFSFLVIDFSAVIVAADNSLSSFPAPLLNKGWEHSQAPATSVLRSFSPGRSSPSPVADGVSAVEVHAPSSLKEPTCLTVTVTSRAGAGLLDGPASVVPFDFCHPPPLFSSDNPPLFYRCAGPCPLLDRWSSPPLWSVQTKSFGYLTILP